MLRQFFHTWYILFILFLAASCNPTKFLSEDEVLHVKNNVEIEQEKEEYKEAVSAPQIKSIVRPRPNNKFLGTRLPQYFYYKAFSDGDTSKFDSFVIKNLAKTPILLDSALVEKSEKDIRTYLFNNGYFNPEVSSNIEIKNKLSTATYSLNPNLQHVYGAAEFEIPDSIENIDDILTDVDIREHVEEGEPYDVNDFNQLRNAVVNNAQNRGYFKFPRNSIFVEPDTLREKGIVDIYVKFEDPNEPNFNQKYYIRDIYTKLGRGVNDNYKEPVEYNGKLFSNSATTEVRPKVLDRFILLQKGEAYSKEKHINTINKLYNLPIVNYSSIDFNEIELNDTLYLDAFISAGSKKPMSIRFEPTLSEFQGPAISAKLTFDHRNIFNGGEHFEFSSSVGFESAQTVGADNKLFGTSYFDVEPRITIPRLLVLEGIFPDTYLNTQNQSTILRTRFGYQDRRGLYRFLETSVGQTWDWQSSPYNRHSLSPLDVSLIRSDIEPFYEEILEEYPSNRYAFEDRFIFASRYTYFFSNQLKRPEKSFYSFTGTLESAGNLIHAFTGGKDTVRVFESEVARYLRGIIDYSYNVRLSERSSFVSRLNMGLALPLGASKSIPAVRQFFAGGSNSMRAWRARSLGPGTFDYTEGGFIDENQLVDQRGDLKLEANVEYRFPFTKLFGQTLEGAVFTDAGNIWTIYEPDEDDGGRPGAEFSEEFMKEIAIGSGAGLRLKIQNFFNIRTDLAFKIKDPILPEGQRWVEGPFELRNANFTVGIGYPF